ncbi:hypothetical protein WN55_00896 [Dufourea novaeangliae]|uniref:Uncharacterized protein n=1 Tax=Dufourea novaeangliae TaxID=178035 RepID=A0A154PD78_DUFNO|nr:hypothetical protein WN55_00896 [Dufourea novaeangliae]
METMDLETFEAQNSTCGYGLVATRRVNGTFGNELEHFDGYEETRVTQFRITNIYRDSRGSSGSIQPASAFHDPHRQIALIDFLSGETPAGSHLVTRLARPEIPRVTVVGSRELSFLQSRDASSGDVPMEGMTETQRLKEDGGAKRAREREEKKETNKKREPSGRSVERPQQHNVRQPDNEIAPANLIVEPPTIFWSLNGSQIRLAQTVSALQPMLDP